LNIDRGTFFHTVYRIEQKLGRAFRELEPYSLFPLDEYFHGARHAVLQVVYPASAPAPAPLRPPFQAVLLLKTA
jgi:hypothetical protein